jgi:hypothetical protein
MRLIGRLLLWFFKDFGPATRRFFLMAVISGIFGGIAEKITKATRNIVSGVFAKAVVA